MGQYYSPVICDSPIPGERKPLAWFYSHDYDNGLKLMEHSYVGNAFVAAVLHYVSLFPSYLTWAGDYADAEAPGVPDNGPNLYQLADDSVEKIVDHSIAYDRDKFTYAVNLTKEEFVRLNEQPVDEFDLQICPLPLLCADGNGRGGGDYGGSDMDFVGRWKGDQIQVLPAEANIGLRFKEITPVFIED